MAKYVASNTLSDLAWENSHLIDGDVAEGIAKLKQQPGQDLVMYGCHDLMHNLLEHDLIDEYRILVHPVLLGKGRNFLEDGAERVDLVLVDTTVIPPGVTILTYPPMRWTAPERPREPWSLLRQTGAPIDGTGARVGDRMCALRRTPRVPHKPAAGASWDPNSSRCHRSTRASMSTMSHQLAASRGLPQTAPGLAMHALAASQW
jgi:hypothetical protein